MEGERERNINVWLPLTCSLLGNWTATDWESSQQPFGSQASAQSTEPHQLGPKGFLNDYCFWIKDHRLRILKWDLFSKTAFQNEENTHQPEASTTNITVHHIKILCKQVQSNPFQKLSCQSKQERERETVFQSAREEGAVSHSSRRMRPSDIFQGKDFEPVVKSWQT